MPGECFTTELHLCVMCLDSSSVVIHTYCRHCRHTVTIKQIISRNLLTELDTPKSDEGETDNQSFNKDSYILKSMLIHI